MASTAIENRVSLRMTDRVLGRWQSRGDGTYMITLNLAGCWGEASEILERWRGYPSPDPAEGWFPCHDAILDAFCDCLSFTFLVERICVERCAQRIRFRRNHCTPCCVHPVAAAMYDPVADVVEYGRGAVLGER